VLTLNQLVTPVTEDQALQTILDTLTDAGFQVTSWQSGAIQLTILRLFAKVWSQLSQTIADIAAGGFTTLSTSKFLTLLARYFYNLERLAPQATIGKFTLTSSAAAPLATWSAGDIIVARSA
jgi:hypothetical protein